MKNYLNKIFYILIFIQIFIYSKSYAKDNKDEILSEAKTTVKIFCELDGLGIRTSSVFWKFYSSFIDWNDEPGWDSVIVISKFEIGKADVVSDEVQVEVVYHIDQDSNGKEDVYQVKNDTENIIYRLINIGGYWKIHLHKGELPPPPHLYSRVYWATK